MSRSWIFTLVIAAMLGFGVKSYLDAEQDKHAQLEQDRANNPIVTGKDGVQKPLFNLDDPRINVVYFGFTRCPDVCPTSLAMLSGALNQVSDEARSKIRPILVTLDPERDSGDDVHQYAQYFHENFEGYRADPKTLDALAKKYGVIHIKTELENSALEYTVDHSSYFYFLAPDGSQIIKVPHTMTPAPLIKVINDLTTETPQ
ncbi:photosynthetic protein synthase I [Vibrio sp. UCD-FRSSP16_10]|uniref:SCO family protein n=1 Tax=unclassified Vibrio TaxID=2614977 RepID=UPI0007FDEB83|nr:MULTISPECIES: SCO family protein [unclassified Vibrio]OBT09494.1 photosynthetic protein synthase I [Vibrio sp. UCD-FRSSP16_30]OBT19536.1 photosynthetic protein synthase I [Vibrio sp. UCD-FRSSP16_10]